MTPDLMEEGARRVSFLPVLIDKQLRPEVLRAGDSRFDEAMRYMDWASEGFDQHGVPRQPEAVNAAAGILLDQLAWWTRALKTARDRDQLAAAA